MVMVTKVDEWRQATDVLPPEVVSEAIFLPLGLTLESLLKSSPTEILLGTLGDARFRTRTPIPIRIQIEGSQFMAEAIEFNEFGFGSSPSEAIRDLQRALVELYFTLDREQDCLGSDLSKLRGSLTAKLAVRK